MPSHVLGSGGTELNTADTGSLGREMSIEDDKSMGYGSKEAPCLKLPWDSGNISGYEEMHFFHSSIQQT